MLFRSFFEKEKSISLNFQIARYPFIYAV